jgi:hypothetical protein
MIGHMQTACRAVAAGVALLSIGVGVMACGGGDDTAADRVPDLHQVQAKVRAARGSLTAEGIYLTDAQIGRRCVTALVANPTAPNREFVRRQFGEAVCVARAGGQPADFCAGAYLSTVADGPVRVPDVTNLRLSDAERAISAASLRFAIRCLADSDDSAVDHPLDVPLSLIRVTRQCPAPGEMVANGSKVALNGVAALPGGFVYRTATLTFASTSTRHPCEDRRNP